MKKSCPQWDSNPGLSAYEANALSIELLEPINIDHPKVAAFTLTFYVNYLYQVVGVTMICRVFFSYNICIVLLFDLLRLLLTVKRYLNVLHD